MYYLDVLNLNWVYFLEEKKVFIVVVEGVIYVFDFLWLKMCLKCMIIFDGFCLWVFYLKFEDKGKKD